MTKTNRKTKIETKIETPVTDALDKVVTLEGVSVQRNTLRDQIVNDLMTIEGFDVKAENARLDMLLHAIELHRLGGINLRVEPLGILKSKMLTEKKGWCETSFAPSLKLVWNGKSMTKSRKGIMKQCGIALHYIVLSGAFDQINGKWSNGNGAMFLNTGVDDKGIALNRHVPADIVKKAAGNPHTLVKFKNIYDIAAAVMAEEGKAKMGGIEKAATDLVELLNNKTFENVPADAWNALSIVVGRISTLFRERDKARSETPTGQKRTAEASAYDTKADAAKPLSERKNS